MRLINAQLRRYCYCYCCCWVGGYSAGSCARKGQSHRSATSHHSVRMRGVMTCCAQGFSKVTSAWLMGSARRQPQLQVQGRKQARTQGSKQKKHSCRAAHVQHEGRVLVVVPPAGHQVVEGGLALLAPARAARPAARSAAGPAALGPCWGCSSAGPCSPCAHCAR